MAVGYNNVDVPACTARGVLVTNTPDVLTETTADFGFALMMAAARRIAESEHFLRRGEWTQWSYDMFTGTDVHGATLGILGMGRIGQAIARRGALGFGMKVIYHNRTRLAPGSRRRSARARSTRTTLLREADHLVLVRAVLGRRATTPIGAAELALMKPSATLTNIARGGIVDDAALAQALRERRIAAAGLDVFEGEPAVHPDLLTVPNVVLTPHIASASVATRRAMADPGGRQPDRRADRRRAADADQPAGAAASGLLQQRGVDRQARMRLPVAAKIALTTAGAIGGVPGSPMPPGVSVLGTMCTSTLGISFMRSTG